MNTFFFFNVVYPDFCARDNLTVGTVEPFLTGEVTVLLRVVGTLSSCGGVLSFLLGEVT